MLIVAGAARGAEADALGDILAAFDGCRARTGASALLSAG
jgi:hypothetical protein